LRSRLFAHRRFTGGIEKRGGRELPARVAIDARAIDEERSGDVGGQALCEIGHGVPSSTRDTMGGVP
jgi:hypothetical protein